MSGTSLEQPSVGAAVVSMASRGPSEDQHLIGESHALELCSRSEESEPWECMEHDEKDMDKDEDCNASKDQHPMEDSRLLLLQRCSRDNESCERKEHDKQDVDREAGQCNGHAWEKLSEAAENKHNEEDAGALV